MTTATKKPKGRNPDLYPKGAAEVDAGRTEVRGLEPGARVKIQRGEAACTDELSARHVGGVTGRVVGDPYVSVGGPNKGDLIQVVKDEATGENLGVPIGRLSRESGSTRKSFGWSASYEREHERIFGKKKRK